MGSILKLEALGTAAIPFLSFSKYPHQFGNIAVVGYRGSLELV